MSRLSWEELHMGIALIASQRSPDEKMKVGACLVGEDGNVIGIGYNGSPYGSDWPNDDSKHETVIHAELNAILHSTGSKKNATLYTTLYPCYQCAKVIVQAKIKRVVYLQLKDGEKEKNQAKNQEKPQEINNYKIEYSKIILEKGNIITEAFHGIKRVLVGGENKGNKISFKYENIPNGTEKSDKFMLNFVPWDFNKKEEMK